MARVCLIRDQALRGVRATGAQRRTAPGVGARRCQRRPRVVTGRPQAGAHPGRQQRQSRHLHPRSRLPGPDTYHRRSGNRHRAGVGAGRPLPVLHLRPRRVGADLPDRRAAWSAPEAHHLRRQLQCPPACIAGWLAAGDGNARQRRLPGCRAGSRQRDGARAVARAAGRIAEFRAQWGYTYLCGTRRRARGAGDGVDRRPHGLAPEGSSGRGP